MYTNHEMYRELPKRRLLSTKPDQTFDDKNKQVEEYREYCKKVYYAY